MGNRRMFSLKIMNSARFLKMPMETQNLYFHLGLRADDDGIVEAFPVMRLTGTTEDSLKILHSKGFVQVLNEDLVTYVTDWLEHNNIRADRKIDSIYKDLLIQINPDVKLIESKKSNKNNTECQTNDGQVTDKCQPKLSKDKLSKDKLSKDNIKPLAVEKFDNETINELVCGFIEARKKTKHPMSDYAVKLLIGKLKKCTCDEVRIKSLEDSILNGWRDIFPDKHEETAKQQVKKSNIKL